MPCCMVMTVPVPSLVTVRVTFTAKFAVTVTAVVGVKVHVPVPVQPPPLQPVKVEPAAGWAASVTVVPLATVVVHVVPQLIPAALVTVPRPLPALATVIPALPVCVCALKVAVTTVDAVSITVHVWAPAQPPPLQPVNTDPCAGVEVRTTAFLPKLAEQVLPQTMPGGLLTTVPAPVAPAFMTARLQACAVVAHAGLE